MDRDGEVSTAHVGRSPRDRRGPAGAVSAPGARRMEPCGVRHGPLLSGRIKL